MNDDETPNDREAIEVGLELLKSKWTGTSDFDKGMRLLQRHIGIKLKRPRQKAKPRPQA